MFNDFDREYWLANRLKVHGVAIFNGDTAPEKRKEIARKAIQQIGSALVVGRGKDGRPKTYADVFEDIYGEPLVQTAKEPATRRESPSAQSAQVLTETVG